MSKFKTAERYAQFQTALDAAYQAASDAQQGLVEDMNAFDCGFAWVVVSDSSFMAWCRRTIKMLNEQAKAVELKDANGVDTLCQSAEYIEFRNRTRLYGDKHYPSGWCFWKPGSFNGQSVGIHEKGAKAFSESLARSLGISCSWSSRLD